LVEITARAYGCWRQPTAQSTACSGGEQFRIEAFAEFAGLAALGRRETVLEENREFFAGLIKQALRQFRTCLYLEARFWWACRVFEFVPGEVKPV